MAECHGVDPRTRSSGPGTTAPGPDSGARHARQSATRSSVRLARSTPSHTPSPSGVARPDRIPPPKRRRSHRTSPPRPAPPAPYSQAGQRITRLPDTDTSHGCSTWALGVANHRAVVVQPHRVRSARPAVRATADVGPIIERTMVGCGVSHQPATPDAWVVTSGRP